jgi:hypothetical protein
VNIIVSILCVYSPYVRRLIENVPPGVMRRLMNVDYLITLLSTGFISFPNFLEFYSIYATFFIEML